MKKHNLLNFILSASLLSGINIIAQTDNPPPKPTPKPMVVTSTQITEVSRERREQSYAKLLEAQRYLWGIGRSRSATGASTGAKLAKQALQKAVELNPNLAEAYTALAEISLSTPPNDIDEAIMLATISTKLNPDNFGAHRILARVYTIKSQIHTASLEPNSTVKAIAEWKEVTRLDPRNAEAWAFLSVFYDKQNRGNDRVDALRKWLSAAAPIETRFYKTMLGNSEDLSPESAAIKLGDALIKAGKPSEAIEILSRNVADDPENLLAIDLLRQAIESGKNTANSQTLQMLQQAVFANPSNLVLVELLSDVQQQLGKTDDAVKTIQNSISTVGENDKVAIANLQVSLGDIYLQANRNNEAISAYEQALTSFGIDKSLLTTEDEREFATKVFEKIIKTYKNAGQQNQVRATIERARVLLGKNDLFADKQLISFLRETGKKQDALQILRLSKKEFEEDYGLLRLEASLLTELGRVEEGVSLIKNLIKNKPEVPSPYYDDFSNYLFISSLYSQAKKSALAIETAKLAFSVAQSEERKQLASLSMATAQNQLGKYKLAEETLRGILKKTPGNPIALNNLGYFLLERNERMTEAVDLIEKALKIDPTNSSYLDSLGWGYYKLGRFSESERYLKEAIRYNSSSPTIYEHLGDLYLKQGKFELAKSSWEKALNLSNDTEGLSRIKAKMAQNSSN